MCPWGMTNFGADPLFFQSFNQNSIDFLERIGRWLRLAFPLMGGYSGAYYAEILNPVAKEER